VRKKQGQRDGSKMLKEEMGKGGNHPTSRKKKLPQFKREGLTVVHFLKKEEQEGKKDSEGKESAALSASELNYSNIPF